MLYAERTVFLSGTPMLSRPRELWAILRSVFKDDVNIKDYYQYANQYCAAFTGQFGIDDSGASNLEDLKKSYLDKFMYRLEKEEVIDLPEKVYVDIDLELNAEVTTTLNKEIEFSIDIDELIKGTVSIGEYATVRRELGLLKLEKCIEYIQNVLDTTGAVVVFTYHVQLAEELSKHFKTAHITGATPNPIRTNVVRNFQEFGGVIIGTYGAMGTGITLTKSSNVVLCELEYSPRLIDQAVDRCHRIGQKNNVTIHTLLWKKGLERDLYYDLKKKDKTFKSLF